VLLALGLVLGTTTACGLDEQESARPLPGLSVEGPGEGQAPTPTAAATETTVVWLVRRDQLTRVLRRVPADAAEAQLLAALEAGPTEAESARDITTALSPGDVVSADGLAQEGDPPSEDDSAAETSPTGATPPDDVRIARAVVSDDLRARPADQQILGLGQSVLTLTSGGFDAVVFVGADGQPVAVPGPGGRILEGPVRASDYASLRLRD
jgi:hypothetical protein